VRPSESLSRWQSVDDQDYARAAIGTSLPKRRPDLKCFFYMNYWEIIADNLSKVGWSWGYVSAIDSNGQTIFVANAHCDDGKRFVVRADEKLTAFVELESQLSKETQSIPSVRPLP